MPKIRLLLLPLPEALPDADVATLLPLIFADTWLPAVYALSPCRCCRFALFVIRHVVAYATYARLLRQRPYAHSPGRLIAVMLLR